jgi:RecA-family ATPase
MSPAEHKAADIVAIQKDRAQTSKGYPFKTFDEVTAGMPAKRHLIKGIFARGESSAWIAPPKAMKSALLASAAVHVACGANWFGYRSKEAAGVVYFALERADLVASRLQAHKERQNLHGLPIAVVNHVINLRDPGAGQKVLTTIREVEAEFSVSIGLVIIDTFAKLLASGGGNENEAKDQGIVFANLQQIKNATDVHVALIGHTGKDETKGARGSNAILGDVDMMVTISGEGDNRNSSCYRGLVQPRRRCRHCIGGRAHWHDCRYCMDSIV